MERDPTYKPIETLCAKCLLQRRLKCQYMDEVDQIVNRVPTEITPEEASMQIAGKRAEHRDQGCSHPNYDPDFPGKEKL